MANHLGFTLLEVLISLFLLSLLLLGVTASQVASLREARGLYYFQQAMIFAENMREYLAAHNGNPYGYQHRWQQQIQQVLPASIGNVMGVYPANHITVQWGVGGQACKHNLEGVKGCIIVNM